MSNATEIRFGVPWVDETPEEECEVVPERNRRTVKIAVARGTSARVFARNFSSEENAFQACSGLGVMLPARWGTENMIDALYGLSFKPVSEYVEVGTFPSILGLTKQT